MKQRLFVALDVPQNLRQEIAALQNALGKLTMPVVWEEPEKLHLTLNFLGEIQAEQMHKVNNIVRKSVTAFQPFTLSPTFLETLYKRHDPSIIYLGLSGDIEILKELQTDLADKLNELDLPQPEKFLPHITIGRLKRTDPTTTKSFLDKVSNFDFAPLSSFEVQDVTLFRSLVSRSGSHFERIMHFVFSSTP